jgi:2-dehydro-3-deoxyphosphogluconate aldolase / (4S)-4-hydroxy-2-oxoglutarate aldolase
MDKQQQIKESIFNGGLLPLFYNDDAATCLQLMQLCYDCGIRCIEFTNRGKKALDNFRLLIEERNKNMQGLYLGVGTIKTETDALQFLQSGADFLVSPFFNNEVCDAAFINRTLWIPGCMTPKEIQIAEQAGCELIKLFPGNTLLPAFVEAVKPLFPNVQFMVTGGVDANFENLESWFRSGVAAVGMGSKLFDKSLIQSKDFDSIKINCQHMVDIIASLR